MSAQRRYKHRSLLRPLLTILVLIAFFGYGIIALLSQDALWFLGRAELPDPQRIVIRVDGEETILAGPGPEYNTIVDATREALSAFDKWAPGTVGLSEPTLEEYQNSGIVLELYYAEPVNFHLPFNDGKPTALLIPIRGRLAGNGYVFRGKSDRWWAGQLVMSDPQPLIDALSTLGYLKQ